MKQYYITLGHDVLSCGGEFKLLACCQPQFFNTLAEAEDEKKKQGFYAADSVIHSVELNIG